MTSRSAATRALYWSGRGHVLLSPVLFEVRLRFSHNVKTKLSVFRSEQNCIKISFDDRPLYQISGSRDRPDMGKVLQDFDGLLGSFKQNERPTNDKIQVINLPKRSEAPESIVKDLLPSRPSEYQDCCRVLKFSRVVNPNPKSSGRKSKPSFNDRSFSIQNYRSTGGLFRPKHSQFCEYCSGKRQASCKQKNKKTVLIKGRLHEIQELSLSQDSDVSAKSQKLFFQKILQKGEGKLRLHKSNGFDRKLRFQKIDNQFRQLQKKSDKILDNLKNVKKQFMRENEDLPRLEESAESDRSFIKLSSDKKRANRANETKSFNAQPKGLPIKRMSSNASGVRRIYLGSEADKRRAQLSSPQQPVQPKKIKTPQFKKIVIPKREQSGQFSSFRGYQTRQNVGSSNEDEFLPFVEKRDSQYSEKTVSRLQARNSNFPQIRRKEVTINSSNKLKAGEKSRSPLKSQKPNSYARLKQMGEQARKRIDNSKVQVPEIPIKQLRSNQHPSPRKQPANKQAEQKFKQEPDNESKQIQQQDKPSHNQQQQQLSQQQQQQDFKERQEDYRMRLSRSSDQKSQNSKGSGQLVTIQQKSQNKQISEIDINDLNPNLSAVLSQRRNNQKAENEPSEKIIRATDKKRAKAKATMVIKEEPQDQLNEQSQTNTKNNHLQNKFNEGQARQFKQKQQSNQQKKAHRASPNKNKHQSPQQRPVQITPKIKHQKKNQKNGVKSFGLGQSSPQKKSTQIKLKGRGEKQVDGKKKLQKSKMDNKLVNKKGQSQKMDQNKFQPMTKQNGSKLVRSDKQATQSEKQENKLSQQNQVQQSQAELDVSQAQNNQGTGKKMPKQQQPTKQMIRRDSKGIVSPKQSQKSFNRKKQPEQKIQRQSKRQTKYSNDKKKGTQNTSNVKNKDRQQKSSQKKAAPQQKHKFIQESQNDNQRTEQEHQSQSQSRRNTFAQFRKKLQQDSDQNKQKPRQIISSGQQYSKSKYMLSRAINNKTSKQKLNSKPAKQLSRGRDNTQISKGGKILNKDKFKQLQSNSEQKRFPRGQEQQNNQQNENNQMNSQQRILIIQKQKSPKRKGYNENFAKGIISELKKQIAQTRLEAQKTSKQKINQRNQELKGRKKQNYKSQSQSQEDTVSLKKNSLKKPLFKQGKQVKSYLDQSDKLKNRQQQGNQYNNKKEVQAKKLVGNSNYTNNREQVIQVRMLAKQQQLPPEQIIQKAQQNRGKQAQQRFQRGREKTEFLNKNVQQQNENDLRQEAGEQNQDQQTVEQGSKVQINQPVNPFLKRGKQKHSSTKVGQMHQDKGQNNYMQQRVPFAQQISQQTQTILKKSFFQSKEEMAQFQRKAALRQEELKRQINYLKELNKKAIQNKQNPLLQLKVHQLKALEEAAIKRRLVQQEILHGSGKFQSEAVREGGRQIVRQRIIQSVPKIFEQSKLGEGAQQGRKQSTEMDLNGQIQNQRHQLVSKASQYDIRPEPILESKGELGKSVSRVAQGSKLQIVVTGTHGELPLQSKKDPMRKTTNLVSSSPKKIRSQDEGRPDIKSLKSIDSGRLSQKGMRMDLKNSKSQVIQPAGKRNAEAQLQIEQAFEAEGSQAGYRYAPIKKYIQNLPPNFQLFKKLYQQQAERGVPILQGHLMQQIIIAKKNKSFRFQFLAAVQVVLNLSEEYIERLFQNELKPLGSQYGVYGYFGGKWKLCELQGRSWLDVLNKLTGLQGGDAQVGDLLQVLCGVPCKQLSIAAKPDRILKIIEKRSQMDPALSSCEHIFILSSKASNQNVFRLISSSEVQSLDGVTEIVVKLVSNQKQEFYMKWQAIVEEFDQVLVLNCANDYYYGFMEIERPISEPRKVFSAIVKVRSQCTGVFSLIPEQPVPEQKLAILVYFQIEKNKFSYQGKIQGSASGTTFFLKKYAKGNYLFFFQNLAEMKYVMSFAASSRSSFKPGLWLQSSRLGFEDMQLLFMPLINDDLLKSKKSLFKSHLKIDAGRSRAEVGSERKKLSRMVPSCNSIVSKK